MFGLFVSKKDGLSGDSVEGKDGNCGVLDDP